MNTGLVSSHSFGISQSGIVYVKMSKLQGQSSSGKKLTVPENNPQIACYRLFRKEYETVKGKQNIIK